MDQDRNVVAGEGELDWRRELTELRLANGEVLEVPTNVLRLYRSGRGHEQVPGDPAGPVARSGRPGAGPGGGGSVAPVSGGRERVRRVSSVEGETDVVPVIEEELEVGRKVVESGTVRLRKEVSTEEVTVNVPVSSTRYEVERVAKDEVLEAWPEVRREGETTVYPVVEEDVVLTKRLVLREEIRVTERRAQSTERKSVELRREDVVVEREGEDAEDPEGMP